jgi:hypothetical protein
MLVGFEATSEIGRLRLFKILTPVGFELGPFLGRRVKPAWPTGYLGPDPLDEPGAPRAVPTQPSNGGEPSLSRRRIQELADWYADEGHRRHNAGTLDTAALDAELRAILREEVAFLEHLEIEFERGHAGCVCGSVILARPCP